jgi:hypothetical protein
MCLELHLVPHRLIAAVIVLEFKSLGNKILK